jgi:glycosyltransferase involved in cell wall biosynthesis
MTRLSVVLVTMVFPGASEAFSGVEVREMVRQGLDVRVRALRGRRRNSEVLLSDWELGDLDVTSSSPVDICRGLWLILKSPLIAILSLMWVVGSGWRGPVLLVRCVTLLPRMFVIFDECRRTRPDVLHLFWGHYPALLGYMVKRWLPGVHVSMSFAAYDVLYDFRPSVEVARIADSVWTTAEANIPALEARGVDVSKVSVLHRGIDLSRVPEDCRDKDPDLVVTVARLEPNKGVDDVLRAFTRIRLARGGARLMVIGEGPDRGRLERLARDLGISESVTFCGAVGHRQVYAALGKASYFMLLSRSPAERWSNALKEALACRCLCVVTDVPGARELLSCVKYSGVVGQGMWSDAADRLVGMMRAPEVHEEDRDAGRRHVMRNLNVVNVVRARVSRWRGVAQAA